MSEEDRELLRATSKGCSRAFAELFRRHYPRVLRYALSRGHGASDAESVAQETLLAVWRGAGSFNEESRPSTWILGIARRKAADLWRSRTDELPQPSIELQASSDGGVQDMLSREYVGWALDQLRPKHREVLILAFYEDMSCRGMAELLDVPEGTVKSRLYHARENFRAIIEGRHER